MPTAPIVGRDGGGDRDPIEPGPEPDTSTAAEPDHGDEDAPPA